jgi:Tripartite tricarboxylate transporter TctB family
LKIRPAAIFSFCALIFFIVFVYQAQEWRLQARLDPWAIGIPMIILAIIQVILDLKGVRAKQPSDGAPVDFQFSTDVDPAVARRRTLNIFAWILGFFVSIVLLGFTITIPLLVFGYLKFQAGESWVLSIILSICAWLIFYGLFVRLLNLPFPEGLIFTWLGVN